jgi:hypothetical protein
MYGVQVYTGLVPFVGCCGLVNELCILLKGNFLASQTINCLSKKTIHYEIRTLSMKGGVYIKMHMFQGSTSSSLMLWIIFVHPVQSLILYALKILSFS